MKKTILVFVFIVRIRHNKRNDISRIKKKSKLKFMVPKILRMIVVTKRGISFILFSRMSSNSFAKRIIANGMVGIRTLAFIYMPPFRV